LYFKERTQNTAGKAAAKQLALLTAYRNDRYSGGTGHFSKMFSDGDTIRQITE